MKSGRHTHYCPNCKRDVDCPQITHCKRPDETPCIDCRAAAYAKHESGFIESETGKLPKE